MRLEAALLGVLVSGCATDARPPGPSPVIPGEGGIGGSPSSDAGEDAPDADASPDASDAGPDASDASSDADAPDAASDSGVDGADADLDAGDGGPLADALVRWQLPTAAGLEGSPTHCDLDGDGALEGIVPVAVVDAPELSYLVVVDGLTGLPRWESAPGTASYAYPLCVDVNGDAVDDVLVGGRTADLVALSGVDGSKLWSFAESNPGLLAGNTHSPTALSESPSTFFFSTGGSGLMQRVPGQLFAVSTSGLRIA